MPAERPARARIRCTRTGSRRRLMPFPMRIAICSDSFEPEISGIVDSILTCGEELVRRGHHVLYLVPDYGTGAPPSARPGLEVVRLRSMPVLSSPTGQWRLVPPFGASLRPLRRFAADVLHVHTPFGTGLEAIGASRRLKVPLVGTNHSAIEDFVAYVPGLGRGLAGPARRYASWFYNRCALVTAPFGGLIDDMRSAGFRRPALALPNPVRLDRFTPAPPERREALRRSLGLSGRVILYAGRLAPEKNVDLLVEALARLRRERSDVALVVTGYGQAEAELRARSRALQLEGAVRFTGFVSEADLADLYRVADVFAMMSTAETQSLALMNAYASGVPVVAAKARALPHYVPSGCGLLVAPGDTAGLVAALQRLLDDEALRAAMGAEARSFVAQFSAQAIIDRWETLYAEAMSHRAGPAAATAPVC